MPGQDVRQLLLQVDASVAVAQRNLTALRNQVDSDTKAMEDNLARPGDAAENAGQRIAHASNSARAAQQELMHVVRSSADSFAAGQSAATIFSLEIGRIAEATTLAGGGLGKFGEIMAGPWGIAITAGISLLTLLIAGHHGAGDAAHAHETAEETLIRAMAGEADAIQKVNDALRQQREQSEQALQSETRRIAVIYGHAQAQMELARATQIATRAELAQELARAEEAERAANDPTLAQEGGVNPGAAAAALHAGRASELRAQLAALDTVISNADAIMAAQAQQFARAMASPQGRFDTIQNRRQEEFERPYLARYAAATTDQQRAAILEEMTRGEDALRITREAGRRAIDEAEQAERRRNSTVANGAHLTFAEAASIARSGGLQVNSGQRTYAQQAALYNAWVAAGRPRDNPVAPPGTSAHEGARGRWALDIQMRSGVTPGSIRELYRGHGASVDVFPERGHWHVSGSGPGGPSAETQARRQAAAQARQVHNEDQFDTELHQASDRLLAAKRQLAITTEDQVAFAVQQAQAEGQLRDAGYQHQVNEHHLTAAEAKRLTALNDAATEAEVMAIRQREDRRLAADAAQMQQAVFSAERDLLQGRLALATTNADRLAIERRILASERQAELASITRTLTPGSGASPEEIGRALANFQTLDERYRNRGSALDQQYEGAAARRLRELRGEVGDLHTAFENLGVAEMDRLAEATTNEIKTLLHLHGVLGDIIGDFIQLALHRGEMALLDNLLGGKGGGGGGGIGGFLSGLFGGGGGGGIPTIDTSTIPYLPGYASGGMFDVGGTSGIDRNILSINGMPRARVSADERIAVVPRAPQVRIPQAANNNGTVHVQVSLDSGMLQAKIVGTSAGVTASLAPAIAAQGSAGALKTAARRFSRRLPTGT